MPILLHIHLIHSHHNPIFSRMRYLEEHFCSHFKDVQNPQELTVLNQDSELFRSLRSISLYDAFLIGSNFKIAIPGSEMTCKTYFCDHGINFFVSSFRGLPCY